MGKHSSDGMTPLGIRDLGLGIRDWGFVTAACVLAAAGALLAQQSDRARTEGLARRATERLQGLQREADRLASDEQTLLGDLRKLEVERQIRAAELRDVDTQVQEVSTELTAATDRMHTLEQRDLDERPGLTARLVEMYKLGQGRYLRLLLSTTDLQRVAEASRTVAVLAELDRRRIADHQRTLNELKTSRAQLESRREELEKLRGEAQRARASVERAEQAKNDLIRDIDRRRDLNAQFAGELATAQQNLQVALGALASGGAAAEAPALPLRPFRGALPWPVAGSVRRRFGFTAAARGATSNGIEIAAAEGAHVEAIHEGVVAFADTFAGFGNLVILDHGSQAFSLYGNLLDIAVKRGARVDQGEVVGTVGPPAVGPAGLYFELRIDGQPADPLQWLRKR
jgi:septal ring factor EnvC (AmiA/AmiB activator)